MAPLSSSTASASANASKPARPGAYNVNASSMMSLISEVSKYSDSHKRGTGSNASSSGYGLGGNSKVKSTGKVSKTDAIFSKANRGLEARSAKDRTHMLAREDLSTEARRVLEAREKMEKKAELYEKLAKGESVKGVSRDQLREGLLVDFETKAVEESYNDRTRRRKSSSKGKGKGGADAESDSESSSYESSEEDESRTVPKAPGQTEEDDPHELVETTDDLGRTRWVRRSQLPKPRAPSEEPRQSVLEGGRPIFSDDISLASSSNPYAPMGDAAAADNRHTYYGDQTHFHVYQPTPEEIAARRKNLNLDAPLAEHFDSSKEIRNRGAGFMQFSKDEEERKRQMEGLKQERKQTEAERAKMETKGDASKRREAELAERRRLVEEKRRQILEKRKASALEATAREDGKSSKAARVEGSS